MTMADEWNIRKPGGVGVVSSMPFCGYDQQTLASLKRAGYRVYKNGKIWMDGCGQEEKLRADREGR